MFSRIRSQTPKFLALMLIFSCAFNVKTARAASGELVLSELVNGMTIHTVLKTWGAPVSREEQESKRKDIWYYSNARLEFTDGRLTKTESYIPRSNLVVNPDLNAAGEGAGIPAPVAAQNSRSSAEKSSRKPVEQTPQMIDDLLREITSVGEKS